MMAAVALAGASPTPHSDHFFSGVRAFKVRPLPNTRCVLLPVPRAARQMRGLTRRATASLQPSTSAAPRPPPPQRWEAVAPCPLGLPSGSALPGPSHLRLLLGSHLLSAAGRLSLCQSGWHSQSILRSHDCVFCAVAPCGF